MLHDTNESCFRIHVVQSKVAAHLGFPKPNSDTKLHFNPTLNGIHNTCLGCSGQQLRLYICGKEGNLLELLSAAWLCICFALAAMCNAIPILIFRPALPSQKDSELVALKDGSLSQQLNQLCLKGASLSSTCMAFPPLVSQWFARAAMLSGGVTFPSRYFLSSAVSFPHRLQCSAALSI